MSPFPFFFGRKNTLGRLKTAGQSKDARHRTQDHRPVGQLIEFHGLCSNQVHTLAEGQGNRDLSFAAKVSFYHEKSFTFKKVKAKEK